MRFLSDLKTVPPMALFLGVFGLLPFVAGGVGIWLDGLGDLRYALPMLVLIYGAIIASFLGGVRWGAAMQNGTTQEQSRYLVWVSLPISSGPFELHW